MKVSEYHKLPTEYLVFEDSIMSINKEYSHQKDWEDITPIKKVCLKKHLGLKGTYGSKECPFTNYTKRTEEPKIVTELFPMIKDNLFLCLFKDQISKYKSIGGETVESDNDNVHCLVHYDYEIFERNVEGLNWRDFYLTIDNLIKVSGNRHHIFFEGFNKLSDGTLEVVLGS
jgi:hypothetical protein